MNSQCRRYVLVLCPILLVWMGSFRSYCQADAAWSAVEIRNADTGRESAYLSTRERNTLLYINLARLYPKKFAEVCLRPYQKLFHGHRISHPGRTDILSQEGVAAVLECVDAMVILEPMAALLPSRGLSLAAADHVGDQARTGETGHSGEDGTSPFDRMDRYGERIWHEGEITIRGGGGECISYGYDDPMEIVMQLLVDDGVPSRGHRHLMLDRSFNLVGLSIGEHSNYRHICVVDLAIGYQEKNGG